MTIDALSAEAELEIIERLEARAMCGVPEQELPAPTMQRCSYPAGHKGDHSWQAKQP